MSDDLGFPHDHETIAWENFLAQHIDKRHTEDFVRSFYGPINTLDTVLRQLYVGRWIETAQGNALDGAGNIVGIDRISPQPIYLPFFGFATQPSTTGFNGARLRRHNEPYTESHVWPDTEYRMAIKAKIALNNGHGTAEEIMNALDTALGIDGTFLFDIGNAKFAVFIPKLLTPADPIFYLIEEFIPKAAGVGMQITFVDPNYIFGFVSQGFYGFDVGVMARRIESLLP